MNFNVSACRLKHAEHKDFLSINYCDVCLFKPHVASLLTGRQNAPSAAMGIKYLAVIFKLTLFSINMFRKKIKNLDNYSVIWKYSLHNTYTQFILICYGSRYMSP